MMYEKEVKELEETGSCAILQGGYLYVITDAVMEEGYNIDKHDPYDLEGGPFDGGLCEHDETVSDYQNALNAVNFLL